MKKVSFMVIPEVKVTLSCAKPCAGKCGGNQMNDGFKCYQCDYWRASYEDYSDYCRYYEKDGFRPDRDACENFT